MKLYSDSPEQTIRVGKALGALLHPGSVVCMEGDLGAGKTHFAKGVALGLDIEDHITSPTFTLINEYEGRLPLYHVDAYRLNNEDEAYELGLEEYIYGMGATLIEWPSRVGQFLPDEYLTVMINVCELETETRELNFLAKGSKYFKLVEELEASVYSGY